VTPPARRHRRIHQGLPRRRTEEGQDGLAGRAPATLAWAVAARVAMSGDGRGIIENACGAGRILFALATPFLRRRRQRRGVHDEELRQAFPGDDLVPEPRWQYVHGITVEAPPAMVWPWVAQLGQGRGGFYSYQLLENLVGCQIQNADTTIPSLQAISVGDPIHIHPEMPALRVAIVEPGHALVLHARPGLAAGPASATSTRQDPPNLSWAFVIKEAAGRRSRLFSRYRADYGPGWTQALGYGPWIVEPISYVMDFKMLAGIGGRAVQAARQA